MRDGDDTTLPDDEVADDEAGPCCGERLAEARRARNISLDEIARELHLDETKLRALERNDFEVLGAAVFAKGHLRKYAQIVGVDERDVMADYYELDRSAAAPLVVPGRPRPRREMSPLPWLTGLVALLLILAVYWWFVERDAPAASDTPEPAEEAAIGLPETSSDAVETQDAAAPDEAVAAAQADDAPGGETVTPALATPVASPAEEVPTMRLSIRYSGDCWTEITDAAGRRLFFALGSSGRTVNLSGEPPFNVLFGDADNVSLSVDGAEYPIRPADRRGRTARFTLVAP